jgi:methylmalonyl-CoA/ethylmalonyl-CoA epimerase
MTSVKRINHIAIVVDEIEDALRFWRDALGLKVARVEDVPDQDSVVAFLPVGNMEIELVEPASDESGIARYLNKRGPGIHHICLEVDDIKASLESLKASDVHLINSEPVIGTSGKMFAFIHPESTHGVLIELYELPPK